ncbi:MAG: SPOR domain-containing protein [Flavobacteriales bacterium]|nr:SPOR domain-containing protein [Flavobacteriales bacterium]
MGIERDIHDLLHHHDCVIVPQFGGFLTHYRPARLDEARQIVHPPSKDLSFNRHLVRNDGLLADRLARRETIAFDEAGSRIAGEVRGWRERMEREGRLELGRVGTFFKDGEGNLQFEPDRRVNFLRDAFGLRPVSALPAFRVSPVAPAAITAAPHETIAPVVRTLRPIEPVDPKAANGSDAEATERRMPWLWAAAGTAAVLFLAVAYFTIQARPDTVQWSGLEFFAKAPAPRYHPGTVPATALVPDPMEEMMEPLGAGIVFLPLTGDVDNLLPVDLGDPLAEVAAVDSTHVATHVVTPPIKASTPSAEDRYHVIGGCFSIKENADRFVDDQVSKGHSAHLVDQHRGLYRVAIHSYARRTEALEAMEALRSGEAEGAWLLVQ